MSMPSDVISKDHDLLIAVYTLQQEMIRRLDNYTKSNDDRIKAAEQETQALSRENVRINGDLSSLKGIVSNVDERLDDRLDKLENKSLWMTVGAYIGIIVAGVIAWFKV